MNNKNTKFSIFLFQLFFTKHIYNHKLGYLNNLIYDIINMFVIKNIFFYILNNRRFL